MIWKIFARQPSNWENAEDYAAECYRSGLIAIGWSEVGDLNRFSSREHLEKQMIKLWRKEWSKNPKGFAQSVGSLWSFRKDVEKGDVIICPDKKSKSFYIGIVSSKNVFFDDSPLEERCYFSHRRNVNWIKVIYKKDIQKIWPNGYFGGDQTVTRIKDYEDKRFLSLIKKIVHLKIKCKKKSPISPDKEWGKEAEIRAVEWLKEKGKKPIDVSNKNLGWDIECNKNRYEVKGRKSLNTQIRLTENEWKAAKKHGKNYTILIFTASSVEKLKRTKPIEIPDPTRNKSWTEHTIYEYFLIE